LDDFHVVVVTRTDNTFKITRLVEIRVGNLVNDLVHASNQFSYESETVLGLCNVALFNAPRYRYRTGSN